MITTVRIQRFKSVADMSVELGRLTLLVGPNNAGKSSVLHAIQFATSVCQSLELDGVSRWSNGERSGTLSTEQLIYTPLRDVHALSMGGRLKQEATTAIRVEVTDDSLGSTDILVSRGKNKNISVRVTGEALGKCLSDLDEPFSVVAPGLAGIPSVEEYRARGTVRRAAARGDANSVFRNVLLALKTDSAAWDEFHTSLQEVFHDVELDIDFDHDTGEHINGWVKRAGLTLPIDSSGTGVLQAIQALSYIGVYKPKLLILDEPDSHLHPDNQRKLARLLARLTEREDLQVLMSTHSRHFMDEFGRLEASVHWLSDGARREGQFDVVSALLDLGALDAGDRLRNGETPVVVITEDTDTQGLRTLLLSSGLSDEDFDIWSYASSSKVDSAKLLGRFILDTAPGTRVLVHRDRDYMTDDEAGTFREELEERGLSVLVTTGTDVESHFLSLDYLQEVYPEIDVADLRALLDSATEAVRDESVKVMINAQVEAGYRQRGRGEGTPPSPGSVALTSTASYEADPVRYRHGKKTLKKFRALVQEEHGLNRAVLTTVSRHLEIASVRRLADELRAGTTEESGEADIPTA